jgi:hypothetical protein
MPNKKDEFGYKKGALGKFDNGVKVNRGSSPSSVAGTDPRGTGKYTSDDSGLRTKLPYEETASPRDVYKRGQEQPGRRCRRQPSRPHQVRCRLMQPARKQQPLSLAEQFEASYKETWRLADLLVAQRADYEKLCYPGLPMPTILQGIQQHRACRCIVSLECIEKDKQDGR